MRKYLLLFLAAIVGVCVSKTGFGETRIALVVANGTYPSAPLSSPKLDRVAVAQKLRQMGFLVTEKQDTNRAELINSIREFSEQLRQPDAVGLFYYSGHGMQLNNRNYLIPVDAVVRSEPDVTLFGVPIDDVLRRMELARSKPNIVILDACRNNPFEKSIKGIGADEGLAHMITPVGTIIAFAAAPGKTAEPGTGGNLSTYTRSLVQYLGMPGQDTITTFRAIQNAVYRETQGRQQPYVEFSPGLPDFFFGGAGNVLGADSNADFSRGGLPSPQASVGQPGWSRVNNANCWIWNPLPKIDEVAVRWSGRCQTGFVSGPGRVTWYTLGNQTSWREAHYKGGRVGDGPYSYSNPNGQEFYGQVVGGLVNGYGRFRINSKIYEGTWRDGCFENGDDFAWVTVDNIESDCVRRLKQKRAAMGSR